MAAVREHEGEQVRGRLRGMDRAPEPVLGELGQQTAVIDVGMGQQDEVDGVGLEGKAAVVELTHRLGALEHAAVDQEPTPAVLDPIAGAGHGAGPAMKRQPRRHRQLPPSASAGSMP